MADTALPAWYYSQAGLFKVVNLRNVGAFNHVGSQLGWMHKFIGKMAKVHKWIHQDCHRGSM